MGRLFIVGGPEPMNHPVIRVGHVLGNAWDRIERQIFWCVRESDRRGLEVYKEIDGRESRVLAGPTLDGASLEEDVLQD